MKPSNLKPGAKLKVAIFGAVYDAVFVERFPAENGRKAFNHVRFPAFADNGSDGICQMGDYQLARNGRLASRETSHEYDRFGFRTDLPVIAEQSS